MSSSGRSEANGEQALREAIRTGTEHWQIGLVNGPNMPNLGKRDQKIYGDVLTLSDLEKRVEELAGMLGVSIRAIASNHQGEILDWIHAKTDNLDGIIINPAGLTMFGQPTRHALKDTGLPVIEVHFANIAKHGYPSLFSESVVGTVHGLRKHSYTAALIGMIAMLDDGDFEKPPLYERREQIKSAREASE